MYPRHFLTENDEDITCDKGVRGRPWNENSPVQKHSILREAVFASASCIRSATCTSSYRWALTFLGHIYCKHSTSAPKVRLGSREPTTRTRFPRERIGVVYADHLTRVETQHNDVATFLLREQTPSGFCWKCFPRTCGRQFRDF